jgi:antitoxin (DNA-binding transcriptional repressor) of toxin-antitoxin stability system
MRARFEPLAVALLCAAPAFAQDQAPAPRQTATATVGGKKVAVEYGRPSLRGRPIAELIAQLPADRIWRAGVDAVSTLVTETDLMVGDKKVPAGAYTMYVYAPAEGDWSLVLNRDEGRPAREGTARWPRIGDYDTIADQEVARVAMKTVQLGAPAEMFTVEMAPAGPGAAMTLSWGDRAWTVDLKPAAARAERAPRGKATAMIAGKSVTIDYGRPMLKGRPMSALLAQLPADRMWRAGENQVTTLTTETPLVIGGKRIPAGTYSVYVHVPASGPWSLVLNTDKGVPLASIFPAAPPELRDAPWPHIEDYQKSIASKEVVRAAMTQGAVSEPMDLFTVRLDPLGNGAALTFAWGDQNWSLPIQPGT